MDKKSVVAHDSGLIPEQPSAPALVTEIPGPTARELAARDREVTSPSLKRAYTLVVDRAIGSVVTDTDGNRFLDMTAGIAVTSTGHCHPRVLEAIEHQMRRCLHMSGAVFYNTVPAEFRERLAGIAPMSGPNRVFLSNSGTEAVEAAIKLARYATGRPHIIAFYGGFHGRSMGALSLTASKVTQRRGFSPLLPEVSHVTYPNPYRPMPGVDPSNVVDFTMHEIENVLFKRKVAPDEVAAIIFEPVQGEGGYVVPPSDFLPRLRSLCDKHGILMIADEVQSGMGRTGKMWAIEHTGVSPDILVCSKAIASGLPLGAMVAGSSLMQWPAGAHASTFGGNPVCCAAGLATLDLLQEGLIKNAAVVGDYLLGRLEELKADSKVIGDVRGKGLMIAVELVEDRQTREPAPDLRDRVVAGCFERGLLVLGCGASCVRFSPALTLTKAQVDTTVGIFAGAVSSGLS